MSGRAIAGFKLPHTAGIIVVQTVVGRKGRRRKGRDTELGNDLGTKAKD